VKTSNQGKSASLMKIASGEESVAKKNAARLVLLLQAFKVNLTSSPTAPQSPQNVSAKCNLAVHGKGKPKPAMTLQLSAK
jgi:hypothetical protein